MKNKDNATNTKINSFVYTDVSIAGRKKKSTKLRAHSPCEY